MNNINNRLFLLSVGLSGFLIYIFDKIWGDSIDWDKIREVWIGKFFAQEFTLLEILVFIFIALLIYFLGRRFFKNEYRNTSLIRNQNKLKKFNEQNIAAAGILLRWEVGFYYNNPFIYDLEAYCTRHPGAPIRFMEHRCPDSNCTNHKQEINLHTTQNALESKLIDQWRQLQK